MAVMLANARCIRIGSDGPLLLLKRNPLYQIPEFPTAVGNWLLVYRGAFHNPHFLERRSISIGVVYSQQVAASRCVGLLERQCQLV
jgi:hypothetical protein